MTSLALAAVSSVLMITLYDPANTNRVYFGTDTRAAAILFGAALAAAGSPSTAPPRNETRGSRSKVGRRHRGAIVLAIAWTRLDGQSSTLYRGGFLLCGLAATADHRGRRAPRTRAHLAACCRSSRSARSGSSATASTSTTGPSTSSSTKNASGLTGWPLFLVQTAVTLAVAIASYRIIEQPIRRGRLTSRAVAAAHPAIAIGLVLVLLLSTNGARSHTPVAAAADRIHAAALTRETAPHNAQRILIVGNSVAYDLAVGFQKLRNDPPIVAFNAAVPACSFPPEIRIAQTATASGRVDRPPCHPDWEAAVIERFRPDVVFWIVSDFANHGLRYRGHLVKQCEEPYESLYQRSLREEISKLGASGGRVVVTTEAYIRFYGVANMDKTIDCTNRLRRTVAARTDTKIVDLFEYICPHGNCRGSQDGVTLRPDGQHYTGPGAEIVAQWLLDQVRSS